MPHPALKRVAKLSVTVFGEPAVRIDADQVRHPVRIVFQESYSEMDANGIKIAEGRPTAWIEKTSGIDPADLIEIEGVLYHIDHAEADGYGLLKLELGLQ